MGEVPGKWATRMLARKEMKMGILAGADSYDCNHSGERHT